ncbi:MAG: hypothetical protein VKN72_07025 [Nostocales cyanobacterium 94392]|nr:hypothetical protein [Nostocales cyanobacterium 94392]
MNSFSSLTSQPQNQHERNIIINAIVKQNSDGKIIATVPGLPELQVEASDKITALALLQQRIEAHLAEAEIVPLPIKLPSGERKNPWLEMAGIFKDDPQFEQMLAAIESYREELDKNLEKNTENDSSQDVG